jgi:hypothetical protein
MTPYPTKITFGETRASGVRDRRDSGESVRSRTDSTTFGIKLESTVHKDGPGNCCQPQCWGCFFRPSHRRTIAFFSKDCHFSATVNGHRRSGCNDDLSGEIPQDDLRNLVRVISVCTLGLWAFEQVC